MKLRFGKANLYGQPIPDFTLTHHPDDLEWPPTWLYSWDCESQLGFPTPRPDIVVASAKMKVAPPLFMGTTPESRAKETKFVEENFLKRTGFKDMDAVQTYVDFFVGPSRVKVPYDVLIEPFKKVQARELEYNIDYAIWQMSFETSPRQVYLPLLLMIPAAVHFKAKPIYSCQKAYKHPFEPQIFHTEPLYHGAFGQKMIERHEKELKSVWDKIVAPVDEDMGDPPSEKGK